MCKFIYHICKFNLTCEQKLYKIIRNYLQMSFKFSIGEFCYINPYKFYCTFLHYYDVLCIYTFVYMYIKSCIYDFILCIIVTCYIFLFFILSYFLLFIGVIYCIDINLEYYSNTCYNSVLNYRLNL